MDYQNFKTELLKRLEEFTKDENIEIINKETLKNNGLRLDGIVVQTEGINIAPVIYLEEFYESYLRGEEINDIADEILQIVEKTSIKEDFPVVSVINWDGIKNDLYISVVNADANEELLKTTPHRRIEDLAIYAKIKVNEFEDGEASIRVTNDVLSLIKRTKDEVLNQAISNSEKLEFECKSMREMLFGFMDDDFEMVEEMFPSEMNPPMYVVTANNSIDGASILACRQSLDNVVNRVGDDCFVLPSSIYEILLVPKNAGVDLESLQSMVLEVNRTEVKPGEILSDNVYQYDRKNKKLTIAKADDEVEEKKLSKVAHMAM